MEKDIALDLNRYDFHMQYVVKLSRLYYTVVGVSKILSSTDGRLP